MSITLDAITLPEDLIWTDEFDWSPRQQKETYTLTGALVVELGIKQKGRSITLVGGEQAAWIERSVLMSLYAKLDSASVMTLTLNDARVFSVVFSADSRPIEAALIIDYSTPASTDWYSLTLKLMQV
ncbi:hypothetical protein ABXJ76_07805 [Methylobacter sp. G7]|uniref:hypothetical protein n=1 Tax=Methylobacter sp. G7 TaxID=3230117 RepID=UPI003D802065